MAIPVDRIPSLWEPFQDGRIWRFTEEEFHAMPRVWAQYERDKDGLDWMQNMRMEYTIQSPYVYVKFKKI